MLVQPLPLCCTKAQDFPRRLRMAKEGKTPTCPRAGAGARVSHLACHERRRNRHDSEHAGRAKARVDAGWCVRPEAVANQLEKAD